MVKWERTGEYMIPRRASDLTTPEPSNELTI